MSSAENTNNKNNNTDTNTEQQQQQQAQQNETTQMTSNTLTTPAATSSSTSSYLPMSLPNFLIFSAVSVVSTLALISHNRQNPAFYTQNTEISNGQAMAFLVCFFLVSAFGVVQALVWKNYLTSNNNGNNNGKIILPSNENAGAAAAAVSSISEFVLARRAVISDENYNALFAGFEMSACLLLFFICDRTKLLDRNSKHYSRDTFAFLCLMLLLVGLGTLKRALRPVPKSNKPKDEKDAATNATAATTSANENTESNKSDKNDNNSSAAAATVTVPTETALEQQQQQPDDPNTYHIAHLQRDQTEEWKGWMQVMFLWYHYFEAKEIYNVIRLYIAAYVWMTGFGNFSYYYIRKDFSLLRFCHMQWRLNFLVLWVCLIMQNEYMLYYICMLHTTFTVFIYAGLGIYSHMNTTFTGCCIKFGAMFVFSLVVWDIGPSIFETVWAPFGPIVHFTNPYKPKQDVMYEWFFRSKLDHLVWIFGMICAFNHPTWDGLLKRMDQLPAVTGNAFKFAIVGVCVFLFSLYYDRVLSLPKQEYNKLHPFTSFIPIFLFIVLRNIFQIARQYHIHLFEWLGKITLETYISQYHVWMATTGINGSPKKLLGFLPKEYPLLNFVIASALCLLVSHRLFNSTLALKSYCLPSSLQPEQLRRSLVIMAVWGFGLYICGAALVVGSRGMMISTASSSSSASTAAVAGGGDK